MKKAVKKIELGNTGEMLSQFTLGSMMMGSVINKEDSFKIFDDYVSRGGNFIDTANNYAWWMGTGEFCGDESENIIGDWMKLRKNRSDIFLATKIGARQKDHMAIRDPNGIPRWEKIPDNFEGASRKTIREATAHCLRRLQTDYIDLLYVHVDDRDTDLEETLEEMNSLVEEGIVRYIGYSNIQTWRLERVFNICRQNGWVLPVAIQQEYSYISPSKYHDPGYTNHVKEDFLNWLNSQNTASLVAYSPLLKGIYNNLEKRKSLLENPEYDSTYNIKRLSILDEISKELGTDSNKLALAWMAHKKENIFVILGFSSLDQYMDNIKCIDVEIDDEIMKRLEV